MKKKTAKKPWRQMIRGFVIKGRITNMNSLIFLDESSYWFEKLIRKIGHKLVTMKKGEKRKKRFT
jgi:hypothetical protein